MLVALGRRSSLPALRTISVGYIEAIRGVPLVALLFMGQYVIPLFFPNTVEPPSPLARALIAIVLFEAAYVAETVRGGLQSVPRGQREAAQAIGLSPWKVTRLIVLPQALRAVIPAMVGQFISLFKDTSLLQIIGFVELLEVAENASSQPEFLGQGLHTVTFAFVALIYWAGSYTMSRESRRIEGRLGLGETTMTDTTTDAPDATGDRAGGPRGHDRLRRRSRSGSATSRRCAASTCPWPARRWSSSSGRRGPASRRSSAASTGSRPTTGAASWSTASR